MIGCGGLRVSREGKLSVVLLVEGLDGMEI